MTTRRGRAHTIDYTPPNITAFIPTSGSTLDSTTSTTLGATTSEPATCKYDTTDVAFDAMADTMAGNGTTHTASVSVAVGSNTFYIRCDDALNNTMQTSGSTTFTVLAATIVNNNRRSGGGGGGPGMSAIPELTSTPIQRTLSTLGSFSFTLHGDTMTHTVNVKEITAAGVHFVIRSTAVDVWLSDGQSKDVDITGDGKNELTLALDTSSNYSATFSIATATASTTTAPTSIAPTPPSQNSTEKALMQNVDGNAQASPPTADAPPTANETRSDSASATTNNGAGILWWALVAVAIVAILVVTFGRKKRGHPAHVIAKEEPTQQVSSPEPPVHNPHHGHK